MGEDAGVDGRGRDPCCSWTGQGGGESVEGDRGHFKCELLEFLYILFNMLFCKRGIEKTVKNRGNSNSWSKMLKKK